MKNFEDIFIKNLPMIDLHGYDRESARVATNDFVDEATLMGYHEIVIIHGIGQGIVKDEVYKCLRRNKNVINFKLNVPNIGNNNYSFIF